MKFPTAFQFILAFPAAMLLTGALMERFHILSILASMALKFREISAAFWNFVFGIINLNFAYNPDVLSTYTLLTIPVIISYNRGTLFSEKPNFRIWYIAGIFSLLIILTGYKMWPYILEAFVSLITCTLVSVFIYLFFVTSYEILSVILPKKPSDKLNNKLKFIILLFAITASFYIYAKYLGNIIGTSIHDYLPHFGFELIFWSIPIFFLAPLTKTPVFVVTWTVLLISSDWFERKLLPIITKSIEAV